jgi:hypothetical protein
MYILYINILVKAGCNQLQPATGPGKKIEQPQLLVQLHLVAFGPVAVVFLVAPTEPSNTIRIKKNVKNGREVQTVLTGIFCTEVRPR